jgi:hypothetical protein
MGSFPFGLVATAIGAPSTVAMCGVLTIGPVAYFALFRSQLRQAKSIGEV